MRLAFKYAPKEASKIMQNITKLDKKYVTNKRFV